MNKRGLLVLAASDLFAMIPLLIVLTITIVLVRPSVPDEITALGTADLVSLRSDGLTLANFLQEQSKGRSQFSEMIFLGKKGDENESIPNSFRQFTDNLAKNKINQLGPTRRMFTWRGSGRGTSGYVVTPKYDVHCVCLGVSGGINIIQSPLGESFSCGARVALHTEERRAWIQKYPEFTPQSALHDASIFLAVEKTFEPLLMTRDIAKTLANPTGC